MALLSTKGLYGLMAMYELYQNPSQKPMGVKEIAKRCDISSNYLEQLFTLLKKAKLIQSIRGSKGGYVLVDRDRVTIIDILIALEGEVTIYKSEVTNPIFDLFFKDCDMRLERILNRPLSTLDDYRQLITDSIDFSI